MCVRMCVYHDFKVLPVCLNGSHMLWLDYSQKIIQVRNYHVNIIGVKSFTVSTCKTDSHTNNFIKKGIISGIFIAALTL